MNNEYIAELLTGLVSLTNVIPENLQDGNGDSIVDCLTQGLEDIGEALDVTSLVNWHAVGALANVSVIDADCIKQLRSTLTALSALGEELPV